VGYGDVPGLVETQEAYGETTLVIEPEQLTEAAAYLRDELGFSFLSDVTATDFLGWASDPGEVSGYIGTATGRDLNAPSTQGLGRLPQAKQKRFSVNYHLLALSEGAPRLRLQVWLDDGQSVTSLVPVWPTADWHEREAFDMMGIRFDGHPNLSRILMEDDWAGHPLRKDYPIGGEPVRFSGEE
jgi:NADH:ubiquinone oxidoreductase subunit C